MSAPYTNIARLAILLLLAATIQSIAAVTVGKLGKTATISFDGNASFSDDELRAGLRQYPAFVIDSHREAPLEAFLAQISKALVNGYRKYGFEHPVATAAVNEEGDGILVRIEEGTRVLNGAIIVQGVDERLTNVLRDRLRTGKLDPETGNHKDVAWARDKPTNFEGAGRIGRVVGELLKEEGWFTAKHRFALTSKGDESTLTVTIEDLGVESIIGRITVDGAKRHTKGQILDFLGLVEGAKIDGGILDASRTRLYESGRFIKSDIVMERRTPEGAVVDLDIGVVEADDVPLLSEALPRHTEVFLKGSNWLADFQQSQHDIVLSVSSEGTTAHLALSPQGGLLIAVALPQNGVAAGGLSADVVLLVSASGVLLKVSGAEGVWRYDVSVPLELELMLTPTGEPDRRYSFAAQMKTSTALEKRAALPLRITIDPVVVAMSLGGELDGVEWQGDIMRLDMDAMRLTMDAATGRLLSGFVKNDEGEFSIRTEENGFERMRQALIGDETAVNQYAADALLTSSISYLASALPLLLERIREFDDDTEMPTKEEVEEVLPALHVLLQLGVLSPLDELAKKVTQAGSNLFSSAFRVPQGAGDPIPSNPTMLLVVQLMSAVLDALPDDSWVDRFSQEMVHVAHGNTKYTKQVLNSFYQDTEHIGPVGYLLMAKVLEYFDKQQAGRFAAKGMEQLSAEAFAKDWQLLAQDPAFEQSYVDFANALQTIDAESQAALDRALGEGATAEMVELLAKSDSPKGQAFVEFLTPLMADLWNETLKGQIRQQLQSLARPQAKPAQTIAVVNGVAVPHTALIPWSDGKTKEQATNIAILVELVYQQYMAERADDQPDLRQQIMLHGEPQINMLTAAGMPTDAAMKALLYQHLIQRRMQSVEMVSRVDVEAFYNARKADIRRPLEDVKHQLTLQLTRMRGSQQVDQWLSKLRQDADVKMIRSARPKAPKSAGQFEPLKPADDAVLQHIDFAADPAALEHFLPPHEDVPKADSIEVKNSFARGTKTERRLVLTHNQHFERIDEVRIKGRFRAPGKNNFRFLIGSFSAINNWEFKGRSWNLLRNTAAPTPLNPDGKKLAPDQEQAGKQIVDPAFLKPRSLHEIIVRRVGSDVEMWIDGERRFASEGKMGEFDMSGTVSVYGPIEIQELTIVGVPSKEAATQPKLR